MSTIYNRKYLKSISLRYKRNEVNNMVNTFIRDLISSAHTGKTSYYYNMIHMKLIDPKPNNTDPNTHTIPMNELILLFSEVFPHCDLTFKDTPEEKGILINWS